MSEIQEIIFDESDLAEIITGLFEETNRLAASAKTDSDYRDFKDRTAEYLKQVKHFAKRANASRFDIHVRISMQPTVDLGLAFNLKE